ncbi:TIGR02270 family protein [Pseudomonas sp. NFXW11]|uniref:TIGR02270 family protein n=1 Tax=Pseudomonas sp. NFXW11 TaxID=2819531 RepID=UPI003CEF500F
MAVISSMLEQHAEEASFLMLLRDQAVHAPHYDLADLGQLDERLAAHLDGLRLAPPSALQVLQAQLDNQALGEMFASVLLAFETRDKPALTRLSEHARNALPTRRGYLMALGWLDWQQLAPWIEPLLGAADPLFRCFGLAACGMHRQDPGPALLAELSRDEPLVLARAARTAGELRRRDGLPLLAAQSQHQDPAVAFWANWACAQMGDERALEPLRGFAEHAGAWQYPALCVLLAWQPREHSIAWVKQLLQRPEHSRIGIQAIGLLGDPFSVPWLIQQMSDLPLARVAGEALSLITGVDLAQQALELQELPEFDAGPNDDPEDGNVLMDPDEHLPWPDPHRVAAWWQAHAGHLQEGVGHILGRVQSAGAFQQALLEGGQRQRIAAAYGLARWQPNAPLFPTSAPAWRQKALLAAG